MTTGVVYDQRMADHRCLWDLKYNEKPERFTSVLKRCEELKLLQRCLRLNPREATEEELLKLHDSEMISILKNTENMSDEEALEKLSSKYDFLYIHPSTFQLSLLAAGSTVELVSNILDGKIRNGMAIIRPPGHHAMKSEYCGYCFYNNVAIAAQHALDNRGIKRILIVDWDIHHGQATQQMFYDDPRVLYFSIHGFQKGAFWPHLRESDYHYIGRGAGLGYNINVPMNAVKMGNSDYMAVFHQLLLPIAYEFNPELIIVSAGYDAALGCPEGEMEVTPACYSHFTNSLMGLANGRLAVVLEGGYCLKSLSEGAALTLRTLLGDPTPPLLSSLDRPTESAQKTILNVMYVLRRYWNCLQHLEVFSVHEVKIATKIRENQFWPLIEFLGSYEKPETYPTRDICPVQDPEVAAELDAQLDVLIAGTCLDVQQYRVAFITSSTEYVSLSEIIQHCHILPSDDTEIEAGGKTPGILVNMINSIVDGTCRSGIAIIENFSKSVLDSFKYAINDRNLQNVMFMDMRAHPDCEIQNSFQEDVRILYASLFASESNLQTCGPKPTGIYPEVTRLAVNVGLQKGCGDVDIFSTLFRILLPVAYKFMPQLIVVAADPSPSVGVSSECFGQFIHLLTSLGGGRLAVIFEHGKVSISSLSGLQVCIKALLGDPISTPDGTRHLDAGSICAIRRTIRAQSPYWDALNFDVQLPDVNVLVPPYMNDEKILRYNAELPQH